MSQQHNKIEILSILSENLLNPTPELVPTSLIAGQLGISMQTLQQTLKSMQGMGIIQSDPDLSYTLITREGVSWLSRHRPTR